MKTLLILVSLCLVLTAKANCPAQLKEAINEDRSTLIITFDGLMTAELKAKLLQKSFVKEAKNLCGDSIIGADFYYSKAKAKKAVQCALSFKKEFGSSFRLNLVGHSFGAGKGVFNFLKEAKKKNLQVDNVVTFDPRGYSYRYSNPGSPLVNHFINIYQKVPLAGMKVKGADKEFNVTGQASHIALPRKLSSFALSKTLGSLNCRR